MNTIEHFIEDPQFQQWVKSPTEKNNLFWQNYLPEQLERQVN